MKRKTKTKTKRKPTRRMPAWLLKRFKEAKLSPIKRVIPRNRTRVTHARRNPYRPYFVRGADSKGLRWYLSAGENSFTRHKRFAAEFGSLASAQIAAKRILKKLPATITYIAIRESK